MKKHLLFVAAFFAVLCVNAQVTWNAVDLGLEADAVAFKGIEAEGPESVVLEGLTITFEGQTNWLYKLATTDPNTFIFNENTYSQTFVQGATNGMDGYMMHSTGPSNAVHFIPTVNGSLDFAFKFGYNKRFYIAALTEEDLDEADFSVNMKAYAYDTTKYWGQYIDAVTYEFYIPEIGADGKAIPRADTPESPHFTGATINVEAGKEYYAWFGGSKIMFSGLRFTPEVVVPIDTTATVTFEVDDSANKTGTVFKLRGSWITATGVYDPLWSGGADHTSFYDDGTNGDVTAGDHIWSVALELVVNPSVTWKWGFMADGVWGVVGPDQQFTLPDTTNITVTYVIPKKVGINDIKSAKTVLKTEYYSIQGAKLSAPIIGVNIIRRYMSDGTIESRKAIIRK
jgi:hypothetical protein